MGKYAIGVDIGSTSTKAVVLNQEREILWTQLLPTGWSSIDTAAALQEQPIFTRVFPGRIFLRGNRLWQNLCSLCQEDNYGNLLPRTGSHTAFWKKNHDSH